MIACPNCGGSIEGDGFTSVLHCEYAVDDDYWSVEPDGGPIYCREVEEDVEPSEVL